MWINRESWFCVAGRGVNPHQGLMLNLSTSFNITVDPEILTRLLNTWIDLNSLVRIHLDVRGPRLASCSMVGRDGFPLIQMDFRRSMERDHCLSPWISGASGGGTGEMS